MTLHGYEESESLSQAQSVQEEQAPEMCHPKTAKLSINQRLTLDHMTEMLSLLRRGRQLPVTSSIPQRTIYSTTLKHLHPPILAFDTSPQKTPRSFTSAC